MKWFRVLSAALGHAQLPVSKGFRTVATLAIITCLSTGLGGCRSLRRTPSPAMSPADLTIDATDAFPVPPPCASPQAGPDEEEAIVWRCSAAGLDPGLLEALRKVATCFRQQTGSTITVNSGRRTLRHQAELMAALSQKQLEGMYCRAGYPSYIRAIVSARKKSGDVSAQKTYAILRQRQEGFISSHLFGAAVDISPDGIDVAALRALLTQYGFQTLDERNLGVACLHATFKAVPKTIIRD